MRETPYITQTMRYTVEYRRRGCGILSRMHTNSYYRAQQFMHKVLCDEDCSEQSLIDNYPED